MKSLRIFNKKVIALKKCVMRSYLFAKITMNQFIPKRFEHNTNLDSNNPIDPIHTVETEIKVQK